VGCLARWTCPGVARPIKRFARLTTLGRLFVFSASLEQLPGWDSVRLALAEIHASHDELDQFFSRAFDELDTLADQLAAAERQSAAQARQQPPQAVISAESAQQLQQLLAATAHERDELQEIRHSLSALSTQVADAVRSARRGDERPPSAAPSHGAQPADPVLDSVMAQFEILQRDVTRRRVGN
jgi:hypothetical protein